jgi:hypothetical protein
VNLLSQLQQNIQRIGAALEQADQEQLATAEVDTWRQKVYNLSRDVQTTAEALAIRP